MENKTLLIGANGKIGQLIAKLMAKESQPVKAMIRDKQQKSLFDKIGVETVIADLEADFEHAFESCNQVIFTAGSGADTGFDKTLLIDLWGAIKAINYAHVHKIKRFIMVSSRGAANPDNGPERIKPYLIAKHAADFALTHSQLNYTILQPGRLLDEAATGLITTKRPTVPEHQIISREDVANTVYHCLQTPSTTGKTYEIFTGNISIAKAIN
jgi:uncharacterized protein YbjT (DUF2867 family)